MNKISRFAVMFHVLLCISSLLLTNDFMGGNISVFIGIPGTGLGWTINQPILSFLGSASIVIIAIGIALTILAAADSMMNIIKVAVLWMFLTTLSSVYLNFTGIIWTVIYTLLTLAYTAGFFMGDDE